ncbi:L-fuculose-phosphate aldolase [Vagococcus hydrophili]|uniref:L-fuculose-phosphate aldolase n=1 Tax=Vagococcus hydrophili TaxID=2714947 RepID=A0A6G8ASG7_9ENTE|nr:L-fuculose-phosphate aldolase [Vagococcus hydrophili]QIL47937.1 L-fuculose-phosphate aldolase [Vagococcus hydrophili]
MKYQAERKQLVEYGKAMLTENLTTGTGGNLSIFIREDNVMLMTPSGIPYPETKEEDIVLMTLEGEILEGDCKPSSEYDMHRIFYQQTPNVNAVVHTHSEYATVFACLQEAILPLHYIIGSIGSRVRCCPYETFGTAKLAEVAFKEMKQDKGILLGNHGTLAIGEDLASAFSVAKDIEFIAKLYYRAKSIGTPVLLNEEQLEEVIEKFGTYGQDRIHGTK